MTRKYLTGRMGRSILFTELLKTRRNRGDEMRLWLKTLRNEKKMTMKFVAEELGISESYYCAIENEDRQKDMCISLANRLATIFNISVDQIIEYESSCYRDEKAGMNV